MASVGIVSYGVHIPWYRLNRSLIATALGPLSSGTVVGSKAVANYDEDSLTMAVSAGMDCLKGYDKKKIQGIYFTSTTTPYIERGNSAIIATAIDLPANIRAYDITGSLKSGTGAILSAYDSIKASEAENVLVCGADCRLGKPASMEEMITGDGAAAVMLGSEKVIAELTGSFSLSYDFPDYRRLKTDQFIRAVENRFIREEGYNKIIPEAISGLLKKYNLEPKDINKIAFPSLNTREYSSLGKTLGFQPNQMQKLLINDIGDTGTASPLLLLIAMLEEAKPGDNLLIVSYGNGSDALLFKVTENLAKIVNKGCLKKSLMEQQPLTTYGRYLALRGILPVEVSSAEEVSRTELPLTWRERKGILALYGTKCKRCGTPQYPRQSVCVNPDCGAINEMEEYCFADKKATVFSYTEDYFSSSRNPPLIYGMLEFAGGGRFVFDFTDCESGGVKTGMLFEMSFRRKYLDEVRGHVVYSWKGVPVRK